MKCRKCSGLIGVWILAAGVFSSGCDEALVENILVGLREVSLTTTTDAVNTFFESRFELTAEEEDHADHEEQEGHDDAHAGNQLFVRL